MFYRKDEVCIRNKRAVHRRHQPSKIQDIVKGERTVSEVIRRLGQVYTFKVSNDIGDTRIVSIGLGAGQHSLGEVQTEDRRGTLLSCPAGKPAKAAAKIKYPLPGEIRE